MTQGQGSLKIVSQVMAAYETLATPGSFVHLDRIRPHLDGSRAEQDAALVEMNRYSDVSLEPQSAQMLLTQSQRDGGVWIGNEVKHVIAIG